MRRLLPWLRFLATYGMSEAMGDLDAPQRPAASNSGVGLASSQSRRRRRRRPLWRRFFHLMLGDALAAGWRGWLQMGVVVLGLAVLLIVVRFWLA